MEAPGDDAASTPRGGKIATPFLVICWKTTMLSKDPSAMRDSWHHQVATILSGWSPAPKSLLFLGEHPQLWSDSLRRLRPDACWQFFPHRPFPWGRAGDEVVADHGWGDPLSWSALLANDSWDMGFIDRKLDHSAEAHRLLTLLHRRMLPQGQLLVHVANALYHGVLMKHLVGELPTTHSQGDRTEGVGCRLPAAIKMLLDAQWLPDLIASDWRGEDEAPGSQQLREAVGQLGVSEEIARLQLGRSHLLLHCRPIQPWLETSIATVPLSVIVPVNRPWQYECNLLQSPGWRELEGEIIPVFGASSAAEAFARGSLQARYDWRLLIHQDVYLPRGSGYRLAQQLTRQAAEGAAVLPTGFLGLELSTASDVPECRYAGCAVDRTRLHRYPPSRQAIAIDEFGVALHRSTPLSIDPKLGWHLWATDLCLQAKHVAGLAGAAVLDVPVFHNTVGPYQVPPEFFRSGSYLLDKYPQQTDIPTICGHLIRGPDGSKRLEEPVRIRRP
jgi:hypothetical protein